MIYVIQAKGTDLFKLGYTVEVTPNKRLSELQVGCPLDLEVVVFATGNRHDEGLYHLMLRRDKCHVRGEWFRWGPTAERIVGILKCMPPAPVPAKERNPHRRLGAALSVRISNGKSVH